MKDIVVLLLLLICPIASYFLDDKGGTRIILLFPIYLVYVFIKKSKKGKENKGTSRK